MLNLAGLELELNDLVFLKGPVAGVDHCAVGHFFNGGPQPLGDLSPPDLDSLVIEAFRAVADD